MQKKILVKEIGMRIEDLKQDSRNYRKHNDKNISLIRKSVDECGYGRSVVVNKDNEIICGNGLVSSVSKDTKIKVVETNGDELVVVKRNDLKTGDEKQTKLGIYDNSASDSSEFDLVLLSEDFDTSQLEDMGVDIDSIEDSEIGMPELPNGDKEPFQQITFTLADEQAEKVKEALETVKKSENYKYVDTMGNENSNGNALYCIVLEWLNGKC